MNRNRKTGEAFESVRRRLQIDKKELGSQDMLGGQMKVLGEQGLEG